MFKKLIKNKKAQNTAEYAILISLVVAGIIAMQTYAQRALQATVRDAGQYLSTTGAIGTGTEVQYEPYYLDTGYTVTRNEIETQLLDDRSITHFTNSTRTRATGGTQKSDYSDTTLVTGI